MYIPLDPNKVNGFWSKLENSLVANEHSYLIAKGYKSPSIEKIKLDINLVNQLIARLMHADYVRIGANKMLPIPPHFAIAFDNQSKGKVVELITIDDHADTVKNSIELIIQFTFFELKELVELFIPFYVEGISDQEFNIISLEKNEGLIVRRKL